MSWTLAYDTLDLIAKCLYPEYMSRMWRADGQADGAFKEEYLKEVDLRTIDPAVDLTIGKLKDWINATIKPAQYALPPNMELSVSSCIGRDYVLHSRGLTLPYPCKPTVDEIFHAYAGSTVRDPSVNVGIKDGGFFGLIKSMPDLFADWWSDLVDAEVDEVDSCRKQTREACKEFSELSDPDYVVLKQLEKLGKKPDWVLRGAEVSRLVASRNVAVAQAWMTKKKPPSDKFEAIIEYVYESATYESSEAELPFGFTIKVGNSSSRTLPGATQEEPHVFTSGGFIVDECPQPPETITELFDLWAKGKASMPIFTGCGRLSPGTATRCCPPRNS